MSTYKLSRRRTVFDGARKAVANPSPLSLWEAQLARHARSRAIRSLATLSGLGKTDAISERIHAGVAGESMKRRRESASFLSTKANDREKRARPLGPVLSSGVVESHSDSAHRSISEVHLRGRQVDPFRLPSCTLSRAESMSERSTAWVPFLQVFPKKQFAGKGAAAPTEARRPTPCLVIMTVQDLWTLTLLGGAIWTGVCVYVTEQYLFD